MLCRVSGQKAYSEGHTDKAVQSAVLLLANISQFIKQEKKSNTATTTFVLGTLKSQKKTTNFIIIIYIYTYNNTYTERITQIYATNHTTFPILMYAITV